MFYTMGNAGLKLKSSTSPRIARTQLPKVSEKSRVTLVNVASKENTFVSSDQLKKVEYVPSMNDIRAQRAVKLKLQALEKEASKKIERQKEEKARQEKLQMKDREKELKIKQRNEIYALNKAMTELEQQRFQEFCSKKGIVL